MLLKTTIFVLLLSCQLHADSPVKPLPPVSRDAHVVAINQIGYATAQPKRFTAPLSPDGTPFLVRRADDSAILHRGEIHGNIGDFSSFQPAISTKHYVVEIRGGTLEPGVSDPFLIRPDIWREQYWKPAVDFLIDSRSVTGTHPSAFGGCPWRDGNYYDAIVPSLVMLYLSDPARMAAMPRQIDWEADKKRILAPDFKCDAKNPEGGGVMEAVREYYSVLDAPSPDAPDVVKLIHWGAGFYLMKPITKDPMGDPEPAQIHPQTVEQIAYVVWLLQKYPDRAPAGLKAKFTEWAKVAVKRSDNMWDFRRYDEGEHWTIPKLNDVGNWVSFPAIAIAASWVIDDASLKTRLQELAVSHADFVFGRNPRLAAAPHKPEMGFPEIEHGWPVGHKLDICARLETCRGSISSDPGSEMFPFNPEGAFRHAEGWVNYGASWCVSLAYLQLNAAGTTPSSR